MKHPIHIQFTVKFNAFIYKLYVYVLSMLIIYSFFFHKYDFKINTQLCKHIDCIKLQWCVWYAGWDVVGYEEIELDMTKLDYI